MSSRSGGLLANKISLILGHKLADNEVLLCEQLALNYFPGPILTYIECLGRKPLKHTFDGLYAAASRGNIRGAKRGIRPHELRGKLLEVYNKIDAYHKDMSDGEMAAVVELADKYTIAEIDRGIAIARTRKVYHARYVLGVCVGNVGKPTERPKTKIKKFEDNVVRPKSKDVTAAWEVSTKEAQDLLWANEAERAATHDIRQR